MVLESNLISNSITIRIFSTLDEVSKYINKAGMKMTSQSIFEKVTILNGFDKQLILVFGQRT